MIEKLTKVILFSLLCLVYVVFSYSFLGDWLYSSKGSLLMVLLSYLIWGKGFLKKIGLPSNLLTIAKSILLAAIIAACSFLILKYIGSKNHIRIGYYNWRDYYHVMFYVLNEEIVLGAILLFAHTGVFGYSWGLHVGWVAIMFGSSHTHLKTNMYLTEPDAFNLYLGSTEMLIIAAIMAVSILAYWIKKQIPLQVHIQ